MKAISSRDNANVKRLHALATSARERRSSGSTLLDGAHLVQAALDAGWPLCEIVVSEQGLQRPEIGAIVARCGALPALQLTDPLFAHVSPVDSPSGVLAVIDIPHARMPKALRESVLVLDGVQDAGNLGTILRTAAAAGLKEVLLTPGCAQAWSPRVLRAGMGGHFCLNIHEHVQVGEVLRGYPGQILATGLGAGARPLYDCDLRGPVAWLFGAEGQGLSAEVAALANGLVVIPMPGAVESLNVGAAAAICLFEQVRQRRADGRA
ncbi:TrmH family RNA methyltransferase [Aromatoleum petrolei]|uniref:RNA methyltransferase n=1 Tax=Aromatoleum petrolei TaxID=76116 RepID=A0ABX1MZG8_9RHOO|nr:RNA methyltransferase [Aromatoleum petrolei]NMF91299.1 RNA methyltransferase [Aromatoleum petrolei]QTQ34298.1 Putative tRNA/rRNA methyltransferase [Aromatoleum petrolei]